MKRFILGAMLAATVATTATAPAAAYWRGGYYSRPYYGYGGYRAAPVYARPYYYAPPVYYAPPQVYVAPEYGYDDYGYSAPAQYGYGNYGYAAPVYAERGYGRPVYVDRGYRCHSSGAGAVLVAIAGGLIGNSVSRRYDRGVSTVAGAGVGAAIGDTVERNC